MSLLLYALLIIALVGFSALCSGLNIAIMALDTADLKRKARLGNHQAAVVLPLRANSNLSLAAILLVNVAAVSATSLVLESKTTGWIAGLATTLLIVIFGEIFPQAFLVRRALKATARLAPVLKGMIFCTWPLAKPLQLLLDKMFGKHTPRKLQSRQELGLMIAEHADNSRSELDDDEVEIMRGALELSNKRVRDIMTPISHVYWLRKDEVINGAKIDAMKAVNYSRMPVLNESRTACYGVLLMKDLVDEDFDNNPREVDELRLYPAALVGSRMALDTLFRKIIASGTHLMPVEHDDVIVGVVTMEDLIEEIVGHEIEDEADRQRVVSEYA